MHKKMIGLKLHIMVLCAITCANVVAETSATDIGNVKVINIIDAAYLPSIDRLIVASRNGFVGLAEVEGQSIRVQPIENASKEDFTAVEKLSDSQALLGGSKGGMYLYDSNGIQKIADLSEFQEPVLDIGVTKGDIWAVGARGLLARSVDGIVWETIEIESVNQPEINLIPGLSGELYLGLANIDVESIVLNANVHGEHAVAEEDYVIFSDEGFMDIANEFDKKPTPSIAFSFSPGPPFRRGDVSWNSVIVDGNMIILSGEFGLIIRSLDGGETWQRLDAKVSISEPQSPYWLAGLADGNNIYLVGAAGAINLSEDVGESWQAVAPPNKEGIFGLAITNNQDLLVLGAVGLAGILDDGEWTLADRTQLSLQSWLKTAVKMPDGSLICLGGRSTALAYQSGNWSRLSVTLD